jgi:hypothetical protein
MKTPTGLEDDNTYWSGGWQHLLVWRMITPTDLEDDNTYWLEDDNTYWS